MRATTLVQVRFSSRRAVLLAALAAALAVPAGRAAADSVCLRTGTGAPAVDGVVVPGAATGMCNPDPFWTGVTPVHTVASTGMAAMVDAWVYAAVRDEGGTANDFLYVGIDVSGDEDLSAQDAVLLMFDADNNNDWNAGDFYLRIRPTASMSSITSGTLCSQAVGVVEYYERVGATWQLVGDPNVAGAITAKVAYDYDEQVGDPGKIWNLELQIPINRTIGMKQYYNLSLTDPSFFGLGAYLFVDYMKLPMPDGNVMKWPQTMVDRAIDDQNPGVITVSNAPELADASVLDVCFDVNFNMATAWEINGSSAASGDHRIKRMGNNVFKVTFFFDGPGNNPTAFPNGGTVRLRLKPYHAGGSGPVREVTQAVNPGNTSYNAFTSVTFNVDLNVGAPPGWPVGALNFICADLVLEGFTRDDVASNNFKNINYNYFTTSTYAHSFAVGAVDVPGLRPGETAQILLRVVERNGMGGPGGSGGGAVAARLPSRRAGGGVLAAVGVSVLLVGMARAGRGRGRRWRATGAVLAALGIGSCVLPETRPSQLSGEPPSWSFTNARELGMEPVRGEPGWYRMAIPYGEQRQVDVSFDGGPLPYPTRRERLVPVVDGRPGVVRVAVRPGQVHTVVAVGTVDLDGPGGPLPEVGAGGVVLPPETASTPGSYPLRRGRYAPNEHAGALIGSFDDFATGFVVGRSGSIVVPQGASTLSLAVNVPQAAVQGIRGGFDLVLSTTPGPRVPNHTEIQGDGTFQAPVVMPIWSSLASLDVFTFFVTENRDSGGRVTSRSRNPLGSARYTIYETHAQEGVRPTGRR